MPFAYVKQAKVGELAEGENPFNVVRLGALTDVGIAEKVNELIAQGYEMSTKAEYVEAGNPDLDDTLAFDDTMNEGI